ncbi:SAM-dependent methyltransferase [Zoogloea dura]|jgi:precorrin-6Y C5,15-methyltransferase (decarboxylating)|uniref:Tetrapyrrole methylase domain-containing protein n=1 Tax=Zoogloea dura TaxID=2728840 RepID=A0A848G3X9_9RHOO|nr:SAM-dependent methyltransferase [Zoogloea dura]NML25133.1 hypothetical protein [Zoogloea dura]
MSEDNLTLPEAVPADAAIDSAAVPAPARRKAPARSARKTPPDAASADALPTPGEASAAEVTAPATKPKAKRAPRKPKAVEAAPLDVVTADLFASAEVALPALEVAPELPNAEPEAIPEAPVAAPDAPPQLDAAQEPAAPLDVALADAGALESSPEAEGDDEPGAADEVVDGAADEATVEAPRRKRKRRRGRGERSPAAAGEQVEMPGLGEVDGDADVEPVSGDVPGESLASVIETSAPVEAASEPEPLPPLTILSLGLEQPPVLSAAAHAALRSARLILGSADALDRLQDLGLEAPQRLCAADAVHLEVRSAGHAGSVLVVVGDAAGDGPAPELLAELGPAHVRVLPGVGRVQAACAALGVSAEIVSVVDLRRAPLAALRGQLRAHRLLAVPLADAEAPRAVARLLLDCGFDRARVWVCEFPAAGLQARAWLASELVELRDPVDARAVLVIATGPSSGAFSELPGLSDAALGEGAPAALPLAARLLALAWLQPAAWESGWAISDGEASLALEWARAVPTARVRAVGIEPNLLGVSLQEAGIGENLAATPAASPLRCREWPMPDAVFIRGAAGLSDWLVAAWARLAPGGRLVATAEDDQARTDLLAFSAEVPAEAWQEVSLARGETVAGRLRFAPGAPVRLALWRKPALS